MTAPLILGTNSIKSTGYDVANSLRFNDGSSDFLNKTPSGAGNRQTFTVSMWFKRANVGTSQYLFNAKYKKIIFKLNVNFFLSISYFYNH